MNDGRLVTGGMHSIPGRNLRINEVEVAPVLKQF